MSRDAVPRTFSLADTFEEVRRRAGGPGGKAYVAAVGSWLAELGLPPDHLARPLASYLAQFPAYCDVVGDFVLFRAGAVPDQLLAPRGGRAAEPRASYGDASAPPPRFRSDLWRAFISEHPGQRWFVDLETLAIVESSPSGKPVSDEPERYVAVPTISTETQRAHAIRVLSTLVSAEQARALTSGDPWWPHFQKSAGPALTEQILQARTGWISEQVTSWLQKQGLPPQRFIRVKRATAAAAAVAPATPTAPAVGLRQALHQVIDQMSEAELAQLLIPARFLAPAAK